MTLRQALPRPVKRALGPVYFGALDALRYGVRLGHRGAALALGRTRLLELHHFVETEADRTVEIGGLKFDCRDYIPYSRAVTLFTKEPDTIAWIDDFFRPGDVFYDVGANIGVFSLYAARRHGIEVIAFEPAAENFAVLNRNIFLNRLDDKITALNVAAHDETTLARLNVSAVMPGKAGNSFDRPLGELDAQIYEPEMRQGVLGFRIDEMIPRFGMKFPNHVKVDVDGNDPLVLEGLGALRDDPRLKSVAVELKPERSAADRQVVVDLLGRGFKQLTDERYINRDYINSGLAHNHFFVRPS